MQNFKQFKNEYRKLKGALSAAQSGRLSFDKIVQVYGDKYDSIEDFVKAITEIIHKYEASIYVFYNLDRTVNKREFGKFYSRFIHASDDEKLLYESVNGMSYDELLERLNETKEKLRAEERKEEKNIRDIERALAKLEKDILSMQRMKQELVELGIAEDDGLNNVIHIIPEKFVDYLKYLETHHIENI